MSRRGLALSFVACFVALAGCGGRGDEGPPGGGGRGGGSLAGDGGRAGGGAAGTTGAAGTSGAGGAAGAAAGASETTGVAGASGTGGAAGASGTGGSGIGGTGAGGNTFPSDPWCLPGNAKAVVACGLWVATSLALHSTGQAFISIMDDVGGVRVLQWDDTGAWKFLIGLATPSSNGREVVLRVDAQGRPVIAFRSLGGPSIQRWNGTAWSSLGTGLPATGMEGQAGIDLEIDALDRPVLLLNTPVAPWGNQISVLRLEGGTWVRLGGTPYINSMPAAAARLALDSADRVTPHVAYKPVADNKSIVPMRLEGAGWLAPPALARGLDADFDFAVAGGQTMLVYLDGPTVTDARVFVSQGSASGWSPGVALNTDTNLPVWRARILATGPAPGALIVAYEEQDATSGKPRVVFKQAPDWSRVPGDAPLIAGADMRGLAIAADSSRLGVAWTSGAPTTLVAYHDFPR